VLQERHHILHTTGALAHLPFPKALALMRRHADREDEGAERHKFTSCTSEDGRGGADGCGRGAPRIAAPTRRRRRMH
jgi:hypothetical protein